MKTTFRILALLLALAMAVGLAACGDSAPAAPDPNLGVYRLSIFDDMSVEEYAELMEMELEDARNSMQVELKSGGKCSFTIDGDTDTMKWSLSGNKLTITDGSDDILGTLADGVMVLEFDSGNMTFTKDGVETGSSGTGGGIKNINGATPTPEPTPEPWGDEYSAGGITVTFPYDWTAKDDGWAGPWAAIYEDGSMIGALYVQSSVTADPETAAGYLGEVFTRTYGDRKFFCAFRGSQLEGEQDNYSLDLYSDFSDERSLDVRLSLGHASQEELLAFADREIFQKVMASIKVDPAGFVDPNKGVDAAGFERNNDGELTAYIGSDTALVIPSAIQGMAITGISRYAFQGNEDIVSIQLPETLIWIDDYCFDGCTALETVEFNEGLSYIGSHAFRDCSSLKDVELPETVTTVETFAFEDAGHGGYFIAYGPVVYGRGALSGSRFDAIGIGAGSDLSASQIFAGAWADRIIIEEIEGAIGDNCFNNTEFLVDLEIPEGVTSLGQGCFLGSGVEHIVLPETLEEIGENCFSFTSLNYLIVPKSVRRIADDAIAVYVVMLLGTELELGEDAIECRDLLLPTVYSAEDVHFDMDPDHVTVWHQVELGMDATMDETIAFDDFLISQGQEDLTWFGVDPSLLYYDVFDYDTEIWTVKRYLGDGGALCVPLVIPYEDEDDSGVTTCELIGDGCYAGTDVTSLTFHSSVWGMGSRILEGCDELTDLWFNGMVLYFNTEDYASDALAGLPDGVRVHLPESFSEEERAEATENLRNLGLPDSAVIEYFSFR